MAALSKIIRPRFRGFLLSGRLKCRLSYWAICPFFVSEGGVIGRS